MLVDTLSGLLAGRRRGGQAVVVADPVRVRRLSDQEGQQLLRIARRGTGSPIRLRRAMVVLAPAGGNTVPAIARLVQADEDTIRQVIHRFNEMGMVSLDPRWADGRPRLISPDEEQFVVRRPIPAPKRWGGRSPDGASASSPITCVLMPPAGSGWVGNGCGRSCTGIGSPSSGPRGGRGPPTRSARPNSPGSST